MCIRDRRYSAPAIVGGFLVLLVGAVWQATRDLEGHARAGAEVIATALVQELDRNTESHDLTRTMERMVVMLPGLGEPVLMTVAPGSRCDGRTLGEVDLRGLTGATVMAITKDAEGKRRSFVPTATERLDAGDLVAIAGAPEAIEQAREMIEHGTAPPIPIAQRGSRAMTAVSE